MFRLSQGDISMMGSWPEEKLNLSLWSGQNVKLANQMKTGKWIRWVPEDFDNIRRYQQNYVVKMQIPLFLEWSLAFKFATEQKKLFKHY